VLDIIAGGRLEMGVAIGYRKRETAAFGVDFTKRGRMFDEWLQIVTRLWAGETVDFAGQHFSVSGAKVMPPPPRGRIPLYIGGFGEKAIERVMRYGAGYIGNADVFTQYAPPSGQDAASVRITGLFTVVARDPEKALAELAPYYHHVNNSYGAWFAEDKGVEGLQPMSLEAFKASGIMQVMTPDAAVAMFRDLQQRLPLDHYMMMLPPGLPAARFVEYAQVFADEVIPAFR
jgi:alkanesulfonate monooxygenase SsuD/methylene tetrahydromethanopterin reductase-like flavin-dependent oxidoreductase (luciferase family)